jgi:hypothetical protein
MFLFVTIFYLNVIIKQLNVTCSHQICGGKSCKGADPMRLLIGRVLAVRVIHGVERLLLHGAPQRNSAEKMKKYYSQFSQDVFFKVKIDVSIL